MKIGHAPYDYETPVLEVAKQIAEEQGYEVEVVEGDVGFMFPSMEQGDVDIWPGFGFLPFTNHIRKNMKINMGWAVPSLKMHRLDG